MHCHSRGSPQDGASWGGRWMVNPRMCGSGYNNSGNPIDEKGGEARVAPSRKHQGRMTVIVERCAASGLERSDKIVSFSA